MDNQPVWIKGELDQDDINSICQGGCESGAYMPAPEAQKEACQALYKPMLHALRQAWPDSDDMPPAERKELYISINEMLRSLNKQGRLNIRCEWEERDND